MANVALASERPLWSIYLSGRRLRSSKRDLSVTKILIHGSGNVKELDVNTSKEKEGYQNRGSSVDLHRKRVHLHEVFRQSRLVHEIQRHPHQMAFDVLELRLNILGIGKLVEDMTLLDPTLGEEVLIVFQGMDCSFTAVSFACANNKGGRAILCRLASWRVGKAGNERLSLTIFVRIRTEDLPEDFGVAGGA